MAANSERSAKRKGKRRRGPGRPWPKGVSGNPAGRPPVSKEYREFLDQMEPESFQALAEIVRDPAHPARRQTAEYIINRKRGKPTDRVEVGGMGGKPIEREFPAIVEAFKKIAGEG